MNKSIERINELRQVLGSHGYTPYQIHGIITDCIGEKNLDNLADQDAKSVIACLEEYISFAQKCKSTKK
jgi:hypothetical protein